MTEVEARRELDRPLVFGDDAQIRAVNFLAYLEEGRDRLKRCRHGFSKSILIHVESTGRQIGVGEEIEIECACFDGLPPDVVNEIARALELQK